MCSPHAHICGMVYTIRNGIPRTFSDSVWENMAPAIKAGFVVEHRGDPVKVPTRPTVAVPPEAMDYSDTYETAEAEGPHKEQAEFITPGSYGISEREHSGATPAKTKKSDKIEVKNGRGKK